MSDKANSELLAEVQSADHSKLKDVVTVENPAASHDMAMVRNIVLRHVTIVFRLNS